MPPAAPEPMEPVPADRELIGRAWPRILGMLEQRSPHLHAFLQDSQVQSVDDGTLTVAVNGGVAVAMLSRPDERAGVAALVAGLCGQDLAVVFTEMPGAPPAAEPQAAPGEGQDEGPVDHQKIIDEIRAAFDAELIDTENRE